MLVCVIEFGTRLGMEERTRALLAEMLVEAGKVDGFVSKESFLSKDPPAKPSAFHIGGMMQRSRHGWRTLSTDGRSKSAIASCFLTTPFRSLRSSRKKGGRRARTGAYSRTIPAMANSDAKRFWKELLRRRVVRVAVIYLAGAWILAQAVDLLLDAFDASQYMRLVVAGLAVGLPVALVLSWVFDITPSGIERTPDRPEPVDLPPAAPESSIAVLPFANLSQDVENEYFSDGLAEEIRNQLARVSGLRVAARTSSFAFKGRHEDVREIGRRLSVATVLEGGVRKQADTVRIDVQLVSAADGYQIWSQTFERRLDDIFRLQSEVASAVIAAIGPRKTGEEGAPSAPATQSVEAYNLYLLRPPPFSQAHRGIAGTRGGLLRAGHRA